MLKKQRTNILIVDDSPENIDILNNILVDDYIVKIALTGEEALEICNSQIKPELILLDIVMPGGIDGYETLRRLKANAETANIPVIIITVKDSIEDECRGLELGAIDFITRPFHPLIVKMRIKNIIEIIEAENFKEEISQIMNHDIRNPLTIIQCEAQTFLETNRDVNPIIKSKFENIRDSVYRIANLLTVWSILFKIEKGKYHFNPQKIDIVRTVEKIAEHFNCYFEIQNIKLVIKKNRDNAFVFCDEMLLYPIISNLLKNAIEADSKNSVLTITICAADNSDNVSLTIHNKKPIPTSIRDTFFDKYVTCGKLKGTGLGAYSAKLFTEIMGGQITMKTNETEGTSITIFI